jgi:hypothetical protein
VPLGQSKAATIPDLFFRDSRSTYGDDAQTNRRKIFTTGDQHSLSDISNHTGGFHHGGLTILVPFSFSYIDP